MKNTKLLFAGMLSLSMLLAGCSSNTEEKKEEVVEQTDQKEGEALSFTNSTSKTITSIQIKSADDKDFGDNLLEEDLKDGAKSDLYPEAEKGTKYDLQFTADDTTYTVKNLELQNMESIALFLDGETAYVEYSDKDGNKISTKEEKKEEETTEEQAVEQAPVVEEAPAETYSEPVYSEPVYDTPAYDDGGAAAPADDGCLSGISDSDLN